MTSHLPHEDRQGFTPEVMTPAWSRDLAELRLSPFWRSMEDGMERRDTFVALAAQYTTYEDLPDALKSIYQSAARQQVHRHHGRRHPHR